MDERAGAGKRKRKHAKTGTVESNQRQEVVEIHDRQSPERIRHLKKKIRVVSVVLYIGTFAGMAGYCFGQMLQSRINKYLCVYLSPAVA